uniref:Uncharacterized protein n=1 Tax=Utricularia reniformis TaxID=192314 RepID=A0A1Y0B3W4_9LAMI|nr:hypothetical protein AEK19_MT1923 [Utricularia reniformis]ART32090.1 hypothetical protein AEK19_MT1923 [Utricularia reniformis]
MFFGRATFSMLSLSLPYRSCLSFESSLCAPCFSRASLGEEELLRPDSRKHQNSIPR